jgi:hypothetical protein
MDRGLEERGGRHASRGPSFECGLSELTFSRPHDTEKEHRPTTHDTACDQSRSSRFDARRSWRLREARKMR